jgi:hypothetical protein
VCSARVGEMAGVGRVCDGDGNGEAHIHLLGNLELCQAFGVIRAPSPAWAPPTSAFQLPPSVHRARDTSSVFQGAEFCISLLL